MKTFDEAVRLIVTLERGDSVKVPTHEDPAKYDSMHEEIQNHPDVSIFCTGLLEYSIERLVKDSVIVTPLGLLAIAFSHGVVVGMEMEKQDAPTT